MTMSGKHCVKRRNCAFWAISSFVTMFSKSRLLQTRQKAAICRLLRNCRMMERVKMLLQWFCMKPMKCPLQCFIYGYFPTLHKQKSNLSSYTFAIISLLRWSIQAILDLLFFLPFYLFHPRLPFGAKQYQSVYLSWIVIEIYSGRFCLFVKFVCTFSLSLYMYIYVIVYNFILFLPNIYFFTLNIIEQKSDILKNRFVWPKYVIF